MGMITRMMTSIQVGVEEAKIVTDHTETETINLEIETTDQETEIVTGTVEGTETVKEVSVDPQDGIETMTDLNLGVTTVVVDVIGNAAHVTNGIATVKVVVIVTGTVTAAAVGSHDGEPETEAGTGAQLTNLAPTLRTRTPAAAASMDQDLADVEDLEADLMVHHHEEDLMDHLLEEADVAAMMDHPDLIAADLVVAADVEDLTVHLLEEADAVALMARLDLTAVVLVVVEVGGAAAADLMGHLDFKMADLEDVAGVAADLEDGMTRTT